MNKTLLATQQKIDSIADQFEKEWNAVSPIDFEKWSALVDEDQRDQLLEALIRVDLELRQENGLSCQSDSYEHLGAKGKQIVAEVLSKNASDQNVVPQPMNQPPINSPEIVRRSGRFELPVTISNYELIAQVGQGGMGDVYLARHVKFRDRRYAIKVLKKSGFSDRVLSRFEREIEAAGKVKHPNIVYAIDAGNFEGETYLVMEYVRGLNLQQILKQFGPLQVSNACEIIRQAAVGLQHAYETGLTHRDIKPSNLMVSNTHQVKILDLGLAKLREQSDSDELTAEGQILGTPDYIAPERWDEPNAVNITADIYSLGCTLYALLAGHPPFQSDQISTYSAKMSAHVNETPPSIDELRDDIPEGLGSLIGKCLAKDPKDRFQTPADLVDAIIPFSAAGDLSVYDIEHNTLDAESLIPTPIRAQLTDGKRSVVAGRAHAYKNAVRYIAGGVLILVAVLIAWQFIPKTNKETGENNSSGSDIQNQNVVVEAQSLVERFEIRAMRDGSTFRSIGEMQTLQNNDAIQFEVELKEPAYVKLLWIDAKGVAQELFPNDPEKGHRGNKAIEQFTSPVAIDSGWPLEPVGESEMALLIVSRQPILDEPLPNLNLSDTDDDIGSQLISYVATRDLSPQTSKVADDTRGLKTKSTRSNDPILNYLEKLRKNTDAVHAVRIPTAFDN